MNQNIPYEKIKFIEDIKNMTVYHWIRLGICMGCFFWVDFITKLFIGIRATEHILNTYAMGVIDKNSGTNMLQKIGDIYNNGFIFEIIFIIIIVYGLWFLLLFKFGIPKKIINLKGE
jgi:hypothetical protein